MSSNNDLLFPVLGLIAGIIMLAFGFFRRRKAQSFEATPCVPIGSEAAAPPFFISGKADSPEPVNAPLSGESSIFYIETVDQRERNYGLGGSSGTRTHHWNRIATNVYGGFFVRDGNGTALVVPTPENLDLQKPLTSESNELLAGEYDEVKRRTELIIRPGEDVTVKGTPRPLREFLEYMRRNEQLALPTGLVKQLAGMENDPAGIWCFFGEGAETVADAPYADYVSMTASSAASWLAIGALVAALSTAALLHALNVF
jgi:hypothetical protein